MVRRQNNQLPSNLPQLQNLIKRDRESYHEEFQQQYQHFNNIAEVFELTPEQPNKSLEDVIMFLAQVAHCYTTELSAFPQTIINLLERNNTVLDSNMRMAFCRCLIMLRNKNLLAPTDLLALFFKLLTCKDKALRSFLQTHMINDIKGLNEKNRNAKLNSSLQNFMYSMLENSNTAASKMSLDIMVELYKKNVWNDAKTVNVIATACFSKVVKVMVGALKFFLGKDETDPDSSDSDSGDEIDPKEVMMANKVNKKTRKRQNMLDKAKKLAKKTKKKKSNAPEFNFSALQLIHDPQSMAEKLFKQLESSTKRFEVKIMTLDVISRLVGLHDLFLFNLYPYLQRFLQPHQREVTRILQFTAQASHELLPPDVIEPVLKTIANNFVTERNSSDVMAVGLNAIKEICARCPLAMDVDLMSDLAEYKSYRERSVMMAAKTLINMMRVVRPEVLHKKDKGRPTDALYESENKEYGQINAKDFVPGAEAILEEDEDAGIEVNSEDSESDDEQWIDIQHSDDDLTGIDSQDVDDDDEEEEEEDDDDDDDDDDEDDLSEEEKEGSDKKDSASDENNKKQEKKEDRVILKGKRAREQKIEKKKAQAQQISIERLLDDDDFKKIDVHNIRKQLPLSKRHAVGLKRRHDEIVKPPSNLVRLGDIENIHKKRKHDKETRLLTVQEGRSDREKHGYKDNRVNEFCSRTNRERSKKKNYQMIKHKHKGKVKRSFKDKQIALRNHLIKLKKMK